MIAGHSVHCRTTISGLSRQTLVGLEAGTLSDLGFNRVAQVPAVLGLELDPPSQAARARRRGLKAGVAAKAVWRNVAKLAKSLGVHRQGLWA